MEIIKIKIHTVQNIETKYWLGLKLGEDVGSKEIVAVDNKNSALDFVKVKYKKTESVYYLQRLDTSEYLDQGSLTGKMFLQTPTVSIDLSSIYAWTLKGQFMQAIRKSVPELQRVSCKSGVTTLSQDQKIYCRVIPNDSLSLLFCEWA